MKTKDGATWRKNSRHWIKWRSATYDKERTIVISCNSRREQMEARTRNYLFVWLSLIEEPSFWMAAHLWTSGGKLERECRIKKVYANRRKRWHGGRMKTGNRHSSELSIHSEESPMSSSHNPMLILMNGIDFHMMKDRSIALYLRVTMLVTVFHCKCAW